MFAALLPSALDSKVAAFIKKTDRWRAGGALVAAESPEAWAHLESAAQLLKPNRAALETCREAAAKTQKQQHCTVVVPAAAQS